MGSRRPWRLMDTGAQSHLGSVTGRTACPSRARSAGLTDTGMAGVARWCGGSWSRQLPGHRPHGPASGTAGDKRLLFGSERGHYHLITANPLITSYLRSGTAQLLCKATVPSSLSLGLLAGIGPMPGTAMFASASAFNHGGTRPPAPLRDHIHPLQVVPSPCSFFGCRWQVLVLPNSPGTLASPWPWGTLVCRALCSPLSSIADDVYRGY